VSGPARARIATLWHLHQPEYRSPDHGAMAEFEPGEPVMPWVRLHALRGYNDMVGECLRREPPITLNWVPVLLDQIAQYAGGGGDRHLRLTRVRAADLTAAERVEVLSTFVAGNPRMIDAFPGWRALAARVRADDALDVGALRDVQVWSTLAWFGAEAAAAHPAITGLRQKDHGFTEADKDAMLAAAEAIVTALPGRIRALAGTRVGLSVSPYHHPILPLLVDVQHAGRSTPGVPADLQYRWPEDAAWELARAREAFTAWFGRAPRGLWPSEGSVSPEVAELVAAAGYRWWCTDEEVLGRSDGEGSGYGPWATQDPLVTFFRDHDLSDRIGFRYQDRAPVEAVAELCAAADARAAGRVCVIALDGENPWEAYPEAGAPFRSALWDALEARGITLDAAAELPPVGRIRRLHTGSWIGADLRIWCGDSVDHAAWRLLASAREAVAASPQPELGRAALARAAGSDWFWWFGPEFDTPFADTFDALFRSHLRAAHLDAGIVPPDTLDRPVRPAAAAPAPVGLVAPAIGARFVWEDWRGAAVATLPRGGSMAVGSVGVRSVRFGWDVDGGLWLFVPLEGAASAAALWVRVDGWQVRADGAEVGQDGPLSAWRAPGGVIVHRASAGAAMVAVGVEVDGHVAWLPPEGALRLEPPEVGPALRWWSV
jgi:alpha-amylase/alpha-mannosidase (GH57 family)